MNTTKPSDLSVAIETITMAGLSVLHSTPTHKRSEHPIVMVHGMWCVGAVWKPLMIALTLLGYECYAITLRGHGDSKQVQDLGKVSINDYITDVELFLLELNQQVILIGHSMGELIAGQVAGRNPSQVVAHVGLTSAPPRGIMMGIRMAIRMPKYLFRIFFGKTLTLSESDARNLLYNTISPEAAEKLIADMVPESGTAAREITVWKFTFRRLMCPALVIGGRRDVLTPNQSALAERLGADYVTVDTSHMLMNDPNTASVVQTIHAWLTQKLTLAN